MAGSQQHDQECTGALMTSEHQESSPPPPDDAAASASESGAQTGWQLTAEVRASRETIWKQLKSEDFWRRAWGEPCRVVFQAGQLFVDDTKAVMPVSVAVFVGIVPFRQFDLLWYLHRSIARLPSTINEANGVHLRLSIEQKAPGVQMVTVSIIDRSGYPPRGRWFSASKKRWSAFLQALRETSERYTSM